MKFGNKRLESAQIPYLAVAAFLFFFLAHSAPHQVHHLFEPDAEDKCIILTFSEGCQFKPISIFSLSNVQIGIEEIVFSLEAWIPYLTPSPYSKRAPPSA